MSNRVPFNVERYGSTLIEAAREVLTERERTMIDYRHGLTYGGPHTFEEIGESFEITRERAWQIVIRAEKKLARRIRLVADALGLDAARNESGVDYYCRGEKVVRKV